MQSSHYSNALNPRRLNCWAEQKAAAVLAYHAEHMTTRARPFFCFTGLSGVALGTALAGALQRNHPKFKFGLLYVRKGGEKSHGDIVENGVLSLGGKDYLVFVDDFVETGATLIRVCKRLRRWFEEDTLKFQAVCLETRHTIEELSAFHRYLHISAPVR